MIDEVVLKTVIRILGGLISGLLIGAGYWFGGKNHKVSKSFLSSVIILPAVVAVLIYLIGSDLAKAVSVGGVFAFVRFRSVPGNSKDILYIFFAMAVGLAVGEGYYAVAACFAVIITVFFVILCRLFDRNENNKCYLLKVSVPEDMNFQGAFDEVFNKYLERHTMNKIRTSNMGTLFSIDYEIRFKKNADIKAFMDELRCRNGNLNIILGSFDSMENEVL